MVGHGVVVADTPDDFARAVINLMTCDDERRRLEALGLSYVQSHFAPSAAYQPFVDIAAQRLGT
jgi:hypothetical protein